MRLLLAFFLFTSLIGIVLNEPYELPPFKGQTLGWVGAFRHGIRSPHNFPKIDGQELSLYNFSDKEWPKFSDSTHKKPTGKGKLSTHGAEVFRILGEWSRSFMFEDAIGERSGRQDCEWVARSKTIAEGEKSNRCKDSALSFWEGFAPSCQNFLEVVSQDEFEGRESTLFKRHSWEEDDLPTCGGLSETTLGFSALKLQKILLESYKAEVAIIDSIVGPLTPGICGGKECDSLLSIPHNPDLHFDDSQILEGPWGYANFFAQIFLTQYFDNLDVGFGNFPEYSDVQRIARVHYAEDTLRARNPIDATSFGSEFVSQVLYSVVEMASANPSPQLPPLFTFLFGHHQNIYYLLKMLEVNFIVPGLDQDQLPFGCSIYFRVYTNTETEAETEAETKTETETKAKAETATERIKERRERAREEKKKVFVKAYLIAQTPEQQRELTPLSSSNSPYIQELHLRACTETSECELDNLITALLGHIRPECIFNKTLQNFIYQFGSDPLDTETTDTETTDTETTDPTAGEDTESTGEEPDNYSSVIIGIAGMIMALAMVIVIAAFFFKANYDAKKTLKKKGTKISQDGSDGEFGDEDFEGDFKSS